MRATKRNGDKINIEIGRCAIGMRLKKLEISPYELREIFSSDAKAQWFFEHLLISMDSGVDTSKLVME